MTRRFPAGPAALSALVLLVAAALRFRGLGVESLWLDEAFSLAATRGSVGDLLRAALGDVHPPGYYLLLDLWIALGSDSEVWIRSLSALCGVGAVAATLALGQRIGGFPCALAAGAFLAVSQLHVYYSQEARSYALLALASSLCLLAYWCAFESRPRRGIGWIVAAALLALHVHAHAVFLLAGLALHRLVSWLGGDERGSGARALRAAGLVALGWLPWSVVFAGQAREVLGGGFWIPQPTLGTLVQTLSNMLGGAAPTAVLPVPALPSVSQLLGWLFLALGLGWSASRRAPAAAAGAEPSALSRGAALCAITAVSCLLLPFVTSLAVTPIFLQRTAIAAVVPLVLSMAFGIAQLRSRSAVALCIVLYAALALPALARDRATLQNDDWRSITARIRETTPGGARIYCYKPGLALLVEYYLRDTRGFAVLPVETLDETTLVTPILDEDPDADVWLVLGYAVPWERSRLSSALDATLPLREAVTVEGVELRRYGGRLQARLYMVDGRLLRPDASAGGWGVFAGGR